MIMNRLVDWEAVGRAAQAMMAGQARSPFVQDPTMLSTNAAANRQLLYPGGTATNPRSNALTPGVFAPGAGYTPGPGMPGAAQPLGSTPQTTPQAPAPMGVQGYQPLVAPAPAVRASMPPQDATAAQPSGATASGGEPSGTGGADMASRINALFGSAKEPAKPYAFGDGEYSDQNKRGAKLYTPGGQIEDGMITYSSSMPGTPGAGFTSANSRYGGPAGQEPKSEGTPAGSWQYLGSDMSQFGFGTGDQNPVNPNMQGAWQWRESPTARNLPGLRDMLLSLFGGGQAVPDTMPTAPTGGMLPNNQGMAPGDELFRG